MKVLLDTTAYSAMRRGEAWVVDRVQRADIWIAAHAMEVGAELVSADSHFGQIDGLNREMP